jgi:hypothetical protein
MRLPVLAEHFKEHRSQVSDMTFLEFLVMHYKTDVSHDDHDMELPFKKDCCYSASAQTVVLVSPLSIDLFLPLTNTKHQSFYYSQKIQLLAGEIFQPPRV